MSNNILFITEGPVDEMDFVKKMFQIFYPDKEYKVYPYNTNIHDLISKLFEDDKLDEDLDIRLTLREMETDIDRRMILNQKYNDIFLVFDLDPQDNRIEFQKLKRLLGFFNDSSNRGKLYINYPMMQSYKHLKKMPDSEFKERSINIPKIKRYKEIVQKESKYSQVSKYTYPIFMSIVAHHLKKANFILNSSYDLPTKEAFVEWNDEQIFDKQVKYIREEAKVYILNTFIFYIIEYNPKELFKQFITKREILLL